jgi:hypothetical protein
MQPAKISNKFYYFYKVTAKTKLCTYVHLTYDSSPSCNLAAMLLILLHAGATKTGGNQVSVHIIEHLKSFTH